MATGANAIAEEILEKANRKYGFVPNMMRELAKAPAVLKLYSDGQAAMSRSSLTPKQMQAVQLTAVNVMECPYCMAAHGSAMKGQKVAAGEVQAIVEGGTPEDAQLQPYVQATRTLLQKQGKLSEEDVEALEAAGIDRQKTYEIIGLISLKVVTAWVDHLAHLEVDEALR